MEATNVSFGFSVVCSVVCLVALAAYHALLARMWYAHPDLTVYGLSRASRRVWVACMMARKEGILAVQSLRNLIMASTLMASTSMAICVGFLAFLASAKVQTDGSSSSIVFPNDGLFSTKIVVVLCTLSFAFVSYSQSIRFYNHVALMINIKTVTDEEIATIEVEPGVAAALVDKQQISDMFERGAFAATLGLRAYYIFFPAAAWMLGTWYLVVATFFLLVVLCTLDYSKRPTVWVAKLFLTA
ncbi:hypothetical protein DFJ73DRAFT_806736 [Zopfochytrium polystomum]|nr:hypothetical protein DFJ73DRAFT_806736 [Zopfochytrium polystomum]